MDMMAKRVPPDENGVRIAQLDERSYRALLWEHRPLTDFWRVGRGYAKKLEEHGLYTMGDVARCSIGKPNEYYNEGLLYKLFGVNAELLIDHAWGWEPCRMADIKAYRPETNSISSGQVLQCPYPYDKARLVVREMAEAVALELLEKQGFYDTCVSMKSSTVPTMVAAARLFRAKCDYPLHIGVTETGPVRQGLIKSAMGIGALLLDGIGDTIRVSLTDDPVQEVYAARDILKAAGLRKDGVNIVSCPTCGRTRIDLIGLVNRVDEALKNCEKPITVAVMGCVVNGPGEAREADIGIAGGDGWGMIFEKGVQVEKLPYDELLPALLKRIEAL